MENNYVDIIAKNIVSHRKRLKLTQEELANQFGISFQAVSKWESGASMPDINFLPQLAKTFNVSIDSLFRDGEYEEVELKQDAITIVVYDGDKVLNHYEDLTEEIIITLEGKPKDLICYANIQSDDLIVNGGLTCKGNLSCDDLKCGGLSCEGDIEADDISCGGLTVGGNLTVDQLSGGGVTINGDVEADRISSGGLTCNGNIECDTIESKENIIVRGNITCDGSIRAKVIDKSEN